MYPEVSEEIIRTRPQIQTLRNRNTDVSMSDRVYLARYPEPSGVSRIRDALLYFTRILTKTSGEYVKYISGYVEERFDRIPPKSDRNNYAAKTAAKANAP